MDDDSRMSETSSVRNRGQRRAASPLGDLDAAVSLSASHIRPKLRCNACWEPILPDAQSAETCYRTSCGHLFCCKTLKAQQSTRQFPSPTRSTMGGGLSVQQQDGGALVTQANQFSRPSMRSMGRPYAVDASSSSMRNSMANMGGQETPRTIQRPNVGMFDRFARPPIGGTSRPSVQPLGGSRTRLVRPKTPVLQASQRIGFLSKR
ncbi:hypothetical protein AM587_10009686 [Phytophthora nicotianae]|uniref:Uncharacterized protein n=1 Tax=Phytophthora nicotianae TaxID=4792 RepID=A0A0W8CYY3_PHYNI|nr:hypothetical protein AM587_10012096 [Phytophthora nicotianae]KUF89359.1 hypothetical protein AM587_10009686 [Phytophthora nicotianae]